jgi:hypothetical protein
MWGAFFLTFDGSGNFLREQPISSCEQDSQPTHRIASSHPAIDDTDLIYPGYPVTCQPGHIHRITKTRPANLDFERLLHAFALTSLSPPSPGPQAPTATMGKRTKQYKKLMRSFEFLGFRQPYQVLMTSDVLLDTLKIDLVTLTEKVLSTKSLKPMITQCCIVRTTPC